MARVSVKHHVLPLVAFVIFASPGVFQATRGIGGNWIASAEGLATVPGLLLHAVVFVAVVSFLMTRVSGFKTADQANERGYIHYQRNRFVA
jgi:hypothetical protein